MKPSYTVPVKLSEDLMCKLIYIAKAEGRTPNNHFLLMLRNNIAYYERTKGKIPADALRGLDLSEFEDLT